MDHPCLPFHVPATHRRSPVGVQLATIGSLLPEDGRCHLDRQAERVCMAARISSAASAAESL